MVFLIWLVLLAVMVAVLLFVLAFSSRTIAEHYSGGRPVTCPRDQHQAVVNIDLQDAATKAIDGRHDVRLCDCSLWPEREQCGQDCLKQAIAAEPYKEVTPKTGKKQIYHLPVFLAAFVAWYVGALWHSRFMFRETWIHAVGLTQAQVKQIGWWLAPHLLTAAICLLFAYGVAWLLAVWHRKGILQGVLMSVMLGASLIAASSYAVVRMPHELFAVESGYVVLATLTVGAIVGGLYDKLVLRPQ